MNATVLAARDAESAGYAHYMAQQLAATEAQREENKKLAEIRKIRHGIDPHAQAKSTQAILARDPKDDEKHWLRHLPEGVQYRKEDGSVDVGERAVTIEEVSHVEAIRRRPKNSQGQSEKSSVGEEKREVAIQAYLYSPAAPLTLDEQYRLDQLLTKDPDVKLDKEVCINTMVTQPDKPNDIFKLLDRFTFLSPFQYLSDQKSRFFNWLESRKHD